MKKRPSIALNTIIMISEKRVRNKNITMGLLKGTPSERILYLIFVKEKFSSG
jgi:hypothetical protein